MRYKVGLWSGSAIFVKFFDHPQAQVKQSICHSGFKRRFILNLYDVQVVLPDGFNAARGI